MKSYIKDFQVEDQGLSVFTSTLLWNLAKMALKDFLSIRIQKHREKLRNGNSNKVGAKPLSWLEKQKQKLNPKSAVDKAEQLLNLHHKSPKRLRNCQHQVPLQAGRMKCMKKLLKTGGWIKFCFKMQLNHQFYSLLCSVENYSSPSLAEDWTFILWRGKAACLWTGNIRYSWRKGNLTINWEISSVCTLNVRCPVSLFSYFALRTLGPWFVLSWFVLL